MPEHGYDTRFELPAVDDPPETETGVMLLGMDARRLLTGLGVAAVADDPALVALAVERLRHGAPALPPADAVLAAGALRWRSASEALDAAGWRAPASGSPRQAWSRARRLLGGLDLGDAGPATRAYLTACWLRRHEVDACARPLAAA